MGNEGWRERGRKLTMEQERMGRKCRIKGGRKEEWRKESKERKGRKRG